MTAAETPAGRERAAGFIQTRWTVVLSARDPNSPAAADALETLCRAYWYPLYACVRRKRLRPG